MSLLGYIILFSILGGVLSLAGGIAMLIWQDKLMSQVCGLTSFAAGVLIAVSVLDLLPEAFALGDSQLVGFSVLAGILFLYVLEKSSVWWHHHHETDIQPEIVGVFLGDSLHNLVDGLAIGAAFLISVPAGIATAVAVGMHELPQEIADFSLYIKAGFKKTTTLSLNLVSSLMTLAGSLLVYFLRDSIQGAEVYMLALTAGMFLYIALADLLPELHEHEHEKRTGKELLIFVLGMALVFVSMRALGEQAHSHGESHEHEHEEEVYQQEDHHEEVHQEDHHEEIH